MCNKGLCDLIRKRRLELDYSVDYASELIGLPVDEVESGNVKLNCSHLCMFSRVLELDVDKLYRLNN